MVDPTLSEKVKKGTIWVILVTVVTRGVQLIAEVILARVLMPEDFGLIATALAILAFSEGTVATGFESAIIQKQERPEDYLNSAWTIELIRNVVLFVLIFSLAPLLGSFFNEVRVVAVLRVLSLTFIIQGFKNIGIVYFRKDLDFKKQFFIDSLPLIVYVAFVIPLALVIRSVWALVGAILMRRVSFLLLSYILHPHRPRLELRKTNVKGLFNFGKWIFLSSVIGIVREQGLIMFVSKYLGVILLGVYNRAMVFSSLIFRDIGEIIWKVGYPAFSKLQYDLEGFKKAFLKTLYILTFLITPLAGMIFALSEDFTFIVLTEKWSGIVPVLKVLSISSLLLVINTPSGISFQAMGKPFIGTKIAFIGLAVVLLLIYPLTHQWGLVGAAFSILISALIVTPMMYHRAKRMIGFSAFEFLRPILFAIFNTGVMMATVYLARYYLFTGLDVLGLVIPALLGGLSYLLISLLFEKYFDYQVYRSFKESIMLFYESRGK